MARTLYLQRFGGPEVLVPVDVPDAPPAAGEVRIRHTAIGVNFTDVNGRRGEYPDLVAMPRPVGIGMEGVGVVEAVGPGVTRLAVGDRVAYAARPLGSYCEARNFPADKCVKVPAGLDDVTVAASFLKGLTVEMLIRQIHRVQAGETVVFHAASGGVGSLAGQWLRALGANAVGIVGATNKVALAKADGYAHVFVQSDDWASQVRALTGGRGAVAVYDSVGAATWEGSVACLAPRGWLACFGNTSGLVPPISINTLRDRGSLRLTWARIGEYTSTVPELEASAAAFFAVLASGAVKPRVQRVFKLAEAADAHRMLEARQTNGSLVLVP
jgi:NADPH2:quinone reductase